MTTRLLRSRRSVIPHGETGDLSPNVGHINIYSLTDLAAVRRVLDCVRRAHPFGPHHHDPQEAVRAGDDLVAQVIKSLSESFSEQRAELEDAFLYEAG